MSAFLIKINSFQFGIHPESLSAQTIALTHWSFSVLQLTDLASNLIMFEEQNVSSPFINMYVDKKNVSVCYSSLYRPLSFQYGTENIENLGPLVKMKAEQQKVNILCS